MFDVIAVREVEIPALKPLHCWGGIRGFAARLLEFF